MNAMIFAAGLGTRLKPLTDSMPKALVPVAGKPLLRHVIDKIKVSGIHNIVVNVHHFAQQIIEYVDGEQGVLISDETDLLRDTGGALRHAAALLRGDGGNDYTLVHNVDILSNTDLTAFCANLDGVAARLLVSGRDTQRYLLFDDDMRLVGWTNVQTGEVKTPYEHLDPSRCRKLAFAGIHIISDKLIEEMQSLPERFPIIDFYLSKCREHLIKGYIQPDLRLLDVGKVDTLASADTFLNTINHNSETCRK